MFHRIMVPFDGSPRATDAAAMASHLASRTGASLDLVRVESSEAPERDQVAMDRQMSSELTSMRAGGVDVESHRDIGHANETIIAACKTGRADLIVLAPHHRSRLSRMLPVGMTEYLLVHSPVPLLICPELGQGKGHGQGHPTHSPEPLSGRDGLVICPLDGSDFAERALPYAVGLVRQFERTLLLMRVIVPPHGFASGPQTYEVVREAQRDEEHEACHYLHTIRHRLRHEQDVRVETMLLSGSAAEEILGLSVAHAGSVLVMSTHGRSGLSRMVIGSVTSDVVHGTSVPVFVVPSALVVADTPRVTTRGEAHVMPAAERTTTHAESADEVSG